MSRNTSGTYSPPAGNPVVTGTTITTTWANAVVADIATELTNSLDRQGRGAMEAPLVLVPGTVGTPALTFAGDTDSGLYRSALDTPAIAAGGVKMQEWAPTGTVITGRLATAAPTSPSGSVFASSHDFVSNSPIGLAAGENYPLGTFRTRTSVGPNLVGLSARVRNVGNDGTWSSSEVGISYDVDGTPGAGGALWIGSGRIKPGLYLEFDPAVGNPGAVTAFKNALTPKNLVKSWANIVNSAGALILNDGFNVAAISYPASNTIRVTFAQPMATAAYAVFVVPERGGLPMVAPAIARATTHVDMAFYDSGNNIVPTGSQVFNFSFLVLGAQ